MNEQRVVCAACKCRVTGILVLGARHYDGLMRKQIDSLAVTSAQTFSFEEGFIDQFGEFLTREEAHVIAAKQNQIIRRCGGDEARLYSENLY